MKNRFLVLALGLLPAPGFCQSGGVSGNSTAALPAPPGFQWVADHNGHVPDGAVLAGQVGGRPQAVCRVLYHGKPVARVMPLVSDDYAGRVDEGKCLFAQGVEVAGLADYEVLVGKPEAVRWVLVKKHTENVESTWDVKDAVLFGTAPPPLYSTKFLCRWHDRHGDTYPGEAQGSCQTAPDGVLGKPAQPFKIQDAIIQDNYEVMAIDGAGAVAPSFFAHIDCPGSFETNGAAYQPANEWSQHFKWICDPAVGSSVAVDPRTKKVWIKVGMNRPEGEGVTRQLQFTLVLDASVSRTGRHALSGPNDQAQWSTLGGGYKSCKSKPAGSLTVDDIAQDGTVKGSFDLSMAGADCPGKLSGSFTAPPWKATVQKPAASAPQRPTRTWEGKVTFNNGKLFRIQMNEGGTNMFSPAPQTKFSRDGVAVPLSAIKVGDGVVVKARNQVDSVDAVSAH
jgi:hypothetical protein